MISPTPEFQHVRDCCLWLPVDNVKSPPPPPSHPIVNIEMNFLASMNNNGLAMIPVFRRPTPYRPPLPYPPPPPPPPSQGSGNSTVLDRDFRHIVKQIPLEDKRDLILRYGDDASKRRAHGTAPDGSKADEGDGRGGGGTKVRKAGR